MVRKSVGGQKHGGGQKRTAVGHKKGKVVKARLWVNKGIPLKNSLDHIPSLKTVWSGLCKRPLKVLAAPSRPPSASAAPKRPKLEAKWSREMRSKKFSRADGERTHISSEEPVL